MILIDQPGFMEYIYVRQISFLVKSETAIRPDTIPTEPQLKNTVVRHLTVDIFINVWFEQLFDHYTNWYIGR